MCVCIYIYIYLFFPFLILLSYFFILFFFVPRLIDIDLSFWHVYLLNYADSAVYPSLLYFISFLFPSMMQHDLMCFFCSLCVSVSVLLALWLSRSPPLLAHNLWWCPVCISVNTFCDYLLCYHWSMNFAKGMHVIHLNIRSLGLKLIYWKPGSPITNLM